VSYSSSLTLNRSTALLQALQSGGS
jgi:hypothetical protein